MKKFKLILESLSTAGGELIILLMLNVLYSVAMYFKPDLYKDSHNLVLGALLLIIKTDYTRIKTEYDRLSEDEDKKNGTK